MKSLIKFVTVALLLTGTWFSSFSHAGAQSIVESISLSVTHNLILEHTNNTTTVVQQVMKVGNVSLEGGMGLMDILSDTIYYRAHLFFDLTLLPERATVTQANLFLHVDRFEYPYPSRPTSGTPITYGIYQISESWHPNPTWNWEQNPAILTDTAQHNTFLFDRTGIYTAEVTELVQAWLDNTPNYGLLIGVYPNPDLLAPFTTVLHGPTALERLQPQLQIVYERHLVYLPLIARRYDTRPDLTIDITQPIDPNTPRDLQIVVKNDGLHAATGFWVDAYFDPSYPPEVNQPWPNLCELYGAAWQVSTLGSGESLTLTIGGPYYSTEDSQWPEGTYMSGVHEIWAYVDSWSNQPWGWISEVSEENNRDGPIVFTASGEGVVAEILRPTKGFLPRH